MGIQNTHLLLQFFADNLDGFHQVRVVGDDDCRLVFVLIGVVEEMCCKIHIRSLFFGLDHLDVLRLVPRRVGQRHHHFMRKVVAEDDRDAGEGPQGAQVHLLSLRLMGVVGAGFNEGGKVFNPVDLVFWKQEPAQLFQIEPLVGLPFQGSIIKIEGINVDVCFHSAPEMQKPPEGGFAPCAEATGVVYELILLQLMPFVNSSRQGTRTRRPLSDPPARVQGKSRPKNN